MNSLAEPAVFVVVVLLLVTALVIGFRSGGEQVDRLTDLGDDRNDDPTQGDD